MRGGYNIDEQMDRTDRNSDEALGETAVGPSAETRVSKPMSAVEPPIERGTAIGRYVVLERLGSGTMGIVVAAYDPTLDRKIALKLLRPDPTGASAGQQRLTREAQAMAKLSHPNVVTVFEVGTYEEHVFLAMELIAGATLSEWLARPGRTRREIVDAFLAAGRGLAAAHREGIVHRDFKPANVLVAHDGRVRVADFGLATAPSAPSADLPETLRDSAGELAMTCTGAVLGTPAYMSPEQHRGEPADARADQFAFCVALYEALYRELPFEGDTYLAYHDAVLAGRVREVPRGSDVPARIRRALLRGLALAPGDRFTDMAALLAELGRDAAAARRRLVLAAGGVVVAAAFALVAMHGGAARDPCAAAEEPVASLWGPIARASVEQAFVASRAPGASDTFAHVDRVLAARALALRAARHEACVATEVRHEQSADLLDRRTSCLDDNASVTAALVHVLADHPDASVVSKGVGAALDLPPLESCSDRAALLAAAPPPAPRIAMQVHALRDEVDEAFALVMAGKYQAALAALHHYGPVIDALGYEPLSTKLHQTLADVDMLTSHHELALDELRATLQHAAAAHDDRAFAEVAVALYAVLGNRLGRFEQAAALEPVAAAAVVRAGSTHWLVGLLENARGMLAFGREDYGAALPHLAQAVREREQDAGADSLETADALANEELALEGLGRFDEARAALERTIAIRKAQLGPDHIDVGRAHYALGELLDETGHPADALEEFRASAAVDTKVYPPDNAEIAHDFVSIGVVLDNIGRPNEALDYHLRAVAILELHPVDNARDMSTVLFDLGNTYAQLDRKPEALATYDRALTAATETFGPESPAVANILVGHSGVLPDAPDPDRKRRELERALAIRQHVLGPNHPDVAVVLQNLAELDGDHHDYRGAVDMASRGLAVVERSTAPNHFVRFYLLATRAEAEAKLAEFTPALADSAAARDGFAAAGMAREQITARLVVADAQWGLGTAEARRAGVAEVNAALADLKTLPEPDAATTAKAEAWLAHHR
jgi:tetratricopeptide (TPR) repeat protein